MEKGFFEKQYSKLLSACNAIGSLWIFVLMLVIIVDVGGRIFFNHPMQGTPEIVANSIIAIAFLQIGYVLMIGKHVRSTVFYDRFPEKVREIFDIIACILGIILFIFLVKTSFHEFVHAFTTGEFEGEGALRVPTSPARFAIFFGSALMLGQYFFNIYHKIKKLCKKGV